MWQVVLPVREVFVGNLGVFPSAEEWVNAAVSRLLALFYFTGSPCGPQGASASLCSLDMISVD
jgi:hypothetical protein